MQVPEATDRGRLLVIGSLVLALVVIAIAISSCGVKEVAPPESSAGPTATSEGIAPTASSAPALSPVVAPSSSPAAGTPTPTPTPEPTSRGSAPPLPVRTPTAGFPTPSIEIPPPAR